MVRFRGRRTWAAVAAVAAAIAVVAVAVALHRGDGLGTVAAAAGGESSPVGTPAAPSSGPPRPATAVALCRAALPGSDLLSWTSGTVAQFHAFGYGGPVATHPMASAFAGLPAGTRGAWCAVKVGAQTTRWWAVVDGRAPVRAIDITGPGEGVARGDVGQPPTVP